jgi:excisionase family DNA binding protein
MSNRLLTTDEAAAQLGLTRRQVIKLIGQGRLEAKRFGRAWQVEPESVETYGQTEHKPGWRLGRKRRATRPAHEED